jgi:hypothetical protein
MFWLSSVSASDLQSDLQYFESLQPVPAKVVVQKKHDKESDKSKKEDKPLIEINRFQSKVTTHMESQIDARTTIKATVLDGYDSRKLQTTVYAKAQSKKPLFKDALLIGTIQSRQKETITIRFNRIEFSDKTSGSISAYATVESTYHAQHAEKIINTITKTATTILSSQVQNSAGLIMGQSQDMIPAINEVSYNTISQGTLIDIVFDRTQIVAKN